jgi:hypothetical protein
VNPANVSALSTLNNKFRISGIGDMIVPHVTRLNDLIVLTIRPRANWWIT